MHTTHLMYIFVHKYCITNESKRTSKICFTGLTFLLCWTVLLHTVLPKTRNNIENNFTKLWLKIKFKKMGFSTVCILMEGMTFLIGTSWKRKWLSSLLISFCGFILHFLCLDNIYPPMFKAITVIFIHLYTKVFNAETFK